MARSTTRRKPASSRKRPVLQRLLRWAIMAVLIFVGASVAWVALYRFVPPPVTFTMLANAADGRGITKDWMSLSDMDAGHAPRRDRGGGCPLLPASRLRDRRDLQGGGAQCRGRALARRLHHLAADGEEHLPLAGPLLAPQGAGDVVHRADRGDLGQAPDHWRSISTSPRRGSAPIGANAGSMRYFHHDASRLSPTEAARIAAVLPLPKKRGAIAPIGATARYGRSIERRMGVVKRGGLDACLR